MTDYEKMKEIINEIDTLMSGKTQSSDTIFQVWKSKTNRFLLSKYGANSYEYDEFKKTTFSPTIYFPGEDDSVFIEACHRGLDKTKMIFESYLAEMEERPHEKSSHGNKMSDTSAIFIVHGHDEGMKQSVARLLENQRIKPIILHEQANLGATIIEKFEKNSNVGAAICLFTADDIGKSNDEVGEGKKRARQNVVFEAGFFVGKLKRDHVIFLVDDGVEIPSDLNGVVYTNSKSWQFDVLKELKGMGYKVDLNLLV